MNFDFYDIFSKVIPGGLLIFILIACGYFTPSEKLPDLAYIFISYFVGFLIDGLAAKKQTMNIFWFLFRGKASVVLLKGEKFYGNSYNFLHELKSKLSNNWEEENLSKTFEFIYRKVLTLDTKRVQSFNNHWLNTRNLLLSLVLSTFPIVICTWKGQNSWQTNAFIYSVLIFGIWIIFDRAKGRQYYFVKEVLDSYLFNDKNNGCP